MKTCVFFADRHLIHDEQPHWSWELFLKFIKDFKPDVIVDGGDHLDLPYISSFNRDKLLLLEKKRIKKDFDLLATELRQLRDTTDRMLFLQGNHEQRIDRMIEHQPIFEGDLELENRIDFDGLGIEYYPLNKQPVKIGKLHFLHGTYTGIHHAKKHLLRYMGNVTYGHVHEFQSFYHGIPLRNDEMGANSIGILSSKSPDYLKGRPAHWQNGFSVIYFGDGYFNQYNIIMTKKRFIFNGKEYAL